MLLYYKQDFLVYEVKTEPDIPELKDTLDADLDSTSLDRANATSHIAEELQTTTAPQSTDTVVASS